MIFKDIAVNLIKMVKIELVRRPSLDKESVFLSYLFSTKMQVEQAARILNIIQKEKEPVSETRWKEFVLSSRGLYIKVMRKLRDLGLVEKEMGYYQLSDQFSIALEKMASFWRRALELVTKGTPIEWSS